MARRTKTKAIAIKRAPAGSNGTTIKARLKELNVHEATLTQREREVLWFIAQGFSNANVAGALGLYHERMGVPCEELRMAMPISTRGDDDAPGGARTSVLVASTG